MKIISFWTALLWVLQMPLVWSQSRDTVAVSSRRPATQEVYVVKGKVTDEGSAPFPGVTVKASDSKAATLTALDGTYSIGVNGPDATLTFTAIGYSSQINKVGDQKRLDIKLVPQFTKLTETVVIGYGTVTKRDLTGSVSKVDIADLQKAPVKSIDEALAGRVAGVQVSSNDGKPGSESSILIRGATSLTQSTSPLYVVDGAPIEDFNLSSLNPGDIADIQVLKDASSTAIYGARGANGVIIITTNRGKDGKTQINYNAYYGFQKDIKRIKLMGPYEFVRWQQDFKPANAASKYLDSVGRTLDDYRNIQGIDWQKQVFQVAPYYNHNLSVRGGNKTTRVSLSASITDQKGIIIASGYNRYQGRVTLDHNVNDRFKLGLTSNYSYEKQYGTPTSGNGSSQTKLLYNVYAYRPVTGKGNLNDLLNEKEDLDVVNSIDYRFNPILTAKNEVRDNFTESLNVNTFGEYTFGANRNIKLRVLGGLDRNLQRRDAFDNSNTRSGNPRGSQGTNGVNGTVTYNQNNKYVNENTLTYFPKLNGGHQIDLLIGGTINGQNATSFGFGSIRLPDEDLGIYGLREGIPTQSQLVSSNGSNVLLSGLFRTNYNYNHRYYLTASFRADGSSKFAREHHWGYFPSAALSWRFKEESLLKNFALLSDGKLRVTYGLIGNNRVDNYATIQTLNTSAERSYQFDNGFATPGAVPINLANPSLKWETTSEFNVGLDLGFASQRVTLTAEIYNKVTNDLLLRAQEPLTTGLPSERPSSTGPGSTQENVGALRNRGLELELKAILLNKKFKWNSSFNISFNRNTVLALANSQNSLLSTVGWDTQYSVVPAYIAQIGSSAADIYGYQWAGNYQYSDFDLNETTGKYTLKPGTPYYGTRSTIQPGWIKYKSTTGDSVINDRQARSLGSAYPKFIGGFSNNFTYLGFDLNVFFQFSYGNKVLNANRILFEGGRQAQDQNAFASYANRWTPENQTNEYNVAQGGGSTALSYSTRIVEDGSYLRLKTLSFGYTLPAGLLKALRISQLRVYASAQNVLTWTKYKGVDPEVSTYQAALTPGFDYSTYPRARTTVFGISATF